MVKVKVKESLYCSAGSGGGLRFTDFRTVGICRW